MSKLANIWLGLNAQCEERLGFGSLQDLTYESSSSCSSGELQIRPRKTPDERQKRFKTTEEGAKLRWFDHR